jgi:hypothetical protein
LNVFRIHQGYRLLGPNYGLPVWYVDCGTGLKYDSLELVRKLGGDGLAKDDVVVIRGGMLERGMGVFTEALQYVGVRIEFECEDSLKDPPWFNNVERWVVYWSGAKQFNIRGLRSRQDLLVYSGVDYVSFIEGTSKVGCLRGIIVDDPKSVWELVKNTNVRTYTNVK